MPEMCFPTMFKRFSSIESFGFKTFCCLRFSKMSGRFKDAKGFRRGGAKRHRKFLHENIQSVTKPAFQRQVRRDKVKRISDLIYEGTHKVPKVILENETPRTVAYASRKTVMVMDAVYYPETSGRTQCDFDD